MNEKVRDIVLIGIIGVLVVFMLIPGENDSKDAPSASTETPQVDRADKPIIDTKSMLDKAKTAAKQTSQYYKDLEKNAQMPGTEEAEDTKIFGSLKPSEGIPHKLLPMVKGSVWTYRVGGPKRLVLSDSWTMKAINPPTQTEPGTLEVGFGDEKSLVHVWLENGGIRVDGLPFVEPIEFLGNRPISVQGAFLPNPARIVEHAVWTHEYKRRVIHRYNDKHGKMREVQAECRQRDRAQAKGLEYIAGLTGRFKSRRVSWLSRMEIKAKGRPILKQLTTEPFRKETTWFAEGYGLVRRKIEYLGEEPILFDLVGYTRPK